MIRARLYVALSHVRETIADWWNARREIRVGTLRIRRPR